MKPPSHIRLKLVTHQGLVTITLMLVAAVCFATSVVRAFDYIPLEWLVVQTLSFPLGWLADWCGRFITDSNDPNGFIIRLTFGSIGTFINIRAWVWLAFRCFKRDEIRLPEVREAEFQKLLAEHRKQHG